jgi:hypothetical protein
VRPRLASAPRYRCRFNPPGAHWIRFLRRATRAENEFRVVRDGRTVLKNEFRVVRDGRTVLKNESRVRPDGRTVPKNEFRVVRDGRTVPENEFGVVGDSRTVLPTGHLWIEGVEPSTERVWVVRDRASRIWLSIDNLVVMSISRCSLQFSRSLSAGETVEPALQRACVRRTVEPSSQQRDVRRTVEPSSQQRNVRRTVGPSSARHSESCERSLPRRRCRRLRMSTTPRGL